MCTIITWDPTFWLTPLPLSCSTWWIQWRTMCSCRIWKKWQWPLWMLKISAPYRPRISPREGWTRAGFVCGTLSPKLYTKCGRPLGGWWCIPSGTLQSTRLQCSRRRLRWTNETDTADQNKLIILDSSFTRTFSNHNMVVITTHEKIYYKLAHSVTKNTIYITSSRNQGSVPWIKRLSIIHLTPSMTCKKEEQIKETW
jgi:hypothetical protein